MCLPHSAQLIGTEIFLVKFWQGDNQLMKCTVETCGLKLPPTNTFLCEMLLVNYGFFYMLDLLKYITCESIKSNIKGRVAPSDHFHCVHVHTLKHTHSVTLPEYPYVIN